jgi:hypothetical protein
MIGALRAQELDGGFVLGRMRGRGLMHHKIMEDPLSLIVPLNHPWTSPAELGRASLEFAGKSEGRSSAGPPAHPDGKSPADDTWMPAVKPAMLKDQPMVLEHGIGEGHSDARRALNDALEDRGLSTRDLRVVLEVPDPASAAKRSTAPPLLHGGSSSKTSPAAAPRRTASITVPLRPSRRAPAGKKASRNPHAPARQAPANRAAVPVSTRRMPLLCLDTPGSAVVP